MKLCTTVSVRLLVGAGLEKGKVYYIYMLHIVYVTGQPHPHRPQAEPHVG